MSTQRFNFLLLCFCLFLCCFMYVDSYLIPVKKINEIVIKTQFFENRGLRRSDKIYEIKTNKDDFVITKQLYNLIGEGDTILLLKSILTNSIQKLELQEDDYRYMFEVGFLRARLGMFLVPYLIILIIVNLVMNKKLTNSKGQKHLPYFWLIATLILMGFHLNLDYLFK